MKQVLQHILRHKREYAERPFFRFLRDDALTPRARLAFFPCMAPFIMAFGDLNRHVLRVEPTADAHQLRVNAHTFEDDHHWPWYLEDWVKLGHDAPRRPSEAWREQFDDAHAVNRLLAHRMAHLVWNASPEVRLALIEAIEETGNVLFALTARVARAYERDTGIELRYCGDFHFQLEQGHAMNNAHAELAAIELSPAARAQALAGADEVFEWFGRWTDELHAYALAHPPQQGDVAPAPPAALQAA